MTTSFAAVHESGFGRVEERHGLQNLQRPLAVPGGQWIVQCLDPQGAMFAMVAPER
jgi:uncharacterized protein